MKTLFDISEVIESGKINNELDFERALIAERKLRILSKEDSKYKDIRDKLRDLIENYETKKWSIGSRISEKKLRENDIAEKIAEKERKFINNRKLVITKKLKRLNLTQQNLGEILGHRSKSYMSELMNGLSPFTLKDLIIINRLLKIDLSELIPTFLSQSEGEKVQKSIDKLENPKLKLSMDEYVFA